MHTITELVLEKYRILSNTVQTEIAAVVAKAPATNGCLQPSPAGDSYFRWGGVQRTGYDPDRPWLRPLLGTKSGRNDPFRAKCVE